MTTKTAKRQKMPDGVGDLLVRCHVCGSGCRTTERGTYGPHNDGTQRASFLARRRSKCPQGIGRGQPVPRDVLVAELREVVEYEERSAVDYRVTAERALTAAVECEASAAKRRAAIAALENAPAGETTR